MRPQVSPKLEIISYRVEYRAEHSFFDIKHFLSSPTYIILQEKQDNSDLCLPFLPFFLFQQNLPGEICVTQTGILDILVLFNQATNIC